MKRYQKLVMILETEREDLEWKELLKNLTKHLEVEKVNMREGFLDLVSGEDHIFNSITGTEEEEVGIRVGLDTVEEEIIH